MFLATFLFSRGRQNAPIFSEMKTPSRFAQSGHPPKIIVCPGVCPKTLPRRQSSAFFGNLEPTCFQDPSRSAPGHHFGRFWDGFLMDFDGFWASFLMHFRCISGDKFAATQSRIFIETLLLPRGRGRLSRMRRRYTNNYSTSPKSL